MIDQTIESGIDIDSVQMQWRGHGRGRHRRPRVSLAKHLWALRTRILAGLAAATIGGLIFGMFVGVFT